MTPALIVYLAGVLVGLLGSDAPPITRITLAVLWPVGLTAFAITVAVLVAASLIAFPALALAAAALGGVGAWLLLR